MQIIVLGNSEDQVSRLAGDLSQHTGLPLTELPAAAWTDATALARAIGGDALERDCVCIGGPTSPARADLLRDLGADLDRPSPLVVRIEHDLHHLEPGPASGAKPVLQCRREPGLVRVIRAEAAPEHLLAAALRILEDRKAAEQADPPHWLPTQAPVPARVSPGAAPGKADAADDAGHKTDDSRPPAGAKAASWKKAAEQQGRIKRRTFGPSSPAKPGKPSRKPRRG